MSQRNNGPVGHGAEAGCREGAPLLVEHRGVDRDRQVEEGEEPPLSSI